MKRATKLLFSVFIPLLLGSCFEPEEFSTVPFIEFQSLEYKDRDGLDSLILSFRFEDGDGNIGLDDETNDLLFPFHIYNFIIDADGNVVTIDEPSPPLPLFAAPIIFALSDNGTTEPFLAGPIEPFSEIDNRPAYNCDDYEIDPDSDTLYVSRNELYHNFHIEFREKVNGSYTTIDFAEIFGSDDCDLGNFNGRIPFYDPSGREGVITYSMLSQLFRLSFQDDTIQVRFWVYDRDLNKSNVVESPDFVLKDITQ